MITRFSVKNYKALKDVNVSLSKIHVLIGQNDSGKTSLLEAIQALCLSTRLNSSLKNAFPSQWQGRELVYSKAESPTIHLECQLKDDTNSQDTFRYGLGVTFDARGTCSNAGEQFDRPDFVNVKDSNYSLVSQRNTYVADRVVRLDLIANILSPSALYRFEPRVMATPAGLDQNRRFCMDPDGFGLPTLLDDLLGHDPKRYIQLSDEFCVFFHEFRSVRIKSEQATARIYNQNTIQQTNPSPGKALYFETRDGAEIHAATGVRWGDPVSRLSLTTLSAGTAQSLARRGTGTRGLSQATGGDRPAAQADCRKPGRAFVATNYFHDSFTVCA